MSEFEKRSFDGEVRAADSDDGRMMIRGYASVFDKLSSDLGGFREKIDAAAFNEVLDNDVRAAYNHDANFILGRSKAGTLRIGVDDQGLWYEVDLPDSTMGRDLWESVKRGDIQESSFKFTVLEDDWREADEGVIRTIKKVGRLIDVAPVAYPAYPDATVAARSLEQWRSSEAVVDHGYDLVKRKIDLMELGG